MLALLALPVEVAIACKVNKARPYYCMFMPPLTVKSAPLEKAASSDANQAIIEAISSVPITSLTVNTNF